MKLFFTILLLFFFSMVSVGAFAQEVKLPDDLMDKLANQCCQCLESAKKEAGQSPESIMTSCAQKTFMDNLTEVSQHIPAGELNRQTGEAIGSEMAKMMFKSCPAFAELSIAAAKEKGINNAQTGMATGSTVGKIRKMETNEFARLVVEDGDNRENTFYWLHYFKGSENFINEADKLKGKKVKVQWQEVEYYLPKAKGYYKIKEIKSIEML